MNGGHRSENIAWQICGGMIGLVVGIVVGAPILNAVFETASESLNWVGWLIGPPAGIVVGALLLPALINKRKR